MVETLEKDKKIQILNFEKTNYMIHENIDDIKKNRVDKNKK